MKYTLSPEHKAVLNCYRAYFADEIPSADVLDADMDLMLKIAQSHQIDPMVYHVLRKTERFRTASKEQQLQWRSVVFQRIYQQENKNALIEKVYFDLEKAGIQAIMLKGISLRDVYPHSEYRYSSDEDIWVQAEDADKCDRILREHGFISFAKAGTEYTDPLSIHDISYFNPILGATIELQFNPIGVDIRKRKQINDDILPMHMRHIKRTIGDIEYRCLDTTDNLFFVFSHMVKHFLHQGASIRMCSDVGLLCAKYYADIDWIRFGKLLEEHHLKALFEAVIVLDSENLSIKGLSALCGGKKQTSRELLFDIMTGGAYGTYTNERKISSVITELDMNSGGASLWKRLTRCLFPKYSTLVKYYPSLENRRWTLPLCWIDRWGRIMIHSGKRKEYVQGYLEGERRTHLFRRLGIK